MEIDMCMRSKRRVVDHIETNCQESLRFDISSVTHFNERANKWLVLINWRIGNSVWKYLYTLYRFSEN